MKPSGIYTLERTLSIIASVLVVLIFIGTIIGLSNLKNTKTTTSDNSDNLSKTIPDKIKTDDSEKYFELGNIRIVTAPDSKKKNDKGTAMVVVPWLTYPANNSDFYEELSRKKGILKGIISEYFSERTKAQLLKLSEEKICAELLDQINSELNLGKVSQINFTDYIFFE